MENDEYEIYAEFWEKAVELKMLFKKVLENLNQNNEKTLTKNE